VWTTRDRKDIMHYLFENYALDTDRRELRRGIDLIAVEPQVFDLLVYLIHNRDRVVSKDDLLRSIWHGRIVSDSALNTRINAVRSAIGDNGKDQRLVKTWLRKGVRFVGTVLEERRPPDGRAAKPSRLGQNKPASPELAFDTTADHVPEPVHEKDGSYVLGDEQQEIRYCRAPDGVRLAYVVVGRGPPLVKTANWFNHLEYDWKSPVWRHILRGLASEHTLIRYDTRGSGMSDWEVDEVSLDAWVKDLETVVDTVGVNRFPLLGISQGCAVSIAYAERHPERVSHLVLYGGFALGGGKRSPEAREKQKTMATLMRLEWGADSPAIRQLFTTQFLPDCSKELADSLNEHQRLITSGECAGYLKTVANVDVTELLPKIVVPTLVMHRRGDLRNPIEEGRRIAAGIRGARFVALEGRNHVPLEGEPAAQRFLEEIRLFLVA
jgi:pimeloyl-ACP methyl ester carboxylesterase/DNA-binding winged helix-turn-helix (wHTH) protein